MTVKEIVERYLKDNGFEGLYCYYCGCEVEDLMPCAGTGSDMYAECEPGYKVPCNPETCSADGDCPWHIEGEKK